MQALDITNLLLWLGRIIGFYALLQFSLIVWLWLVHDLPLIKIRKKLYSVPGEVNERNRGRGILRDEQERQIKIEQRPLKAKLELKEYKRNIFLDRVRLISLVKLK